MEYQEEEEQPQPSGQFEQMDEEEGDEEDEGEIMLLRKGGLYNSPSSRVNEPIEIA